MEFHYRKADTAVRRDDRPSQSPLLLPTQSPFQLKLVSVIDPLILLGAPSHILRLRFGSLLADIVLPQHLLTYFL